MVQYLKVTCQVRERRACEAGVFPRSTQCYPSHADPQVPLWIRLKKLAATRVWNKVQLDFSRPGNHTDNAFIKSFNGWRRQECLNGTWYLSLADVAERLAAWRKDCKEVRPHTSLGNLTPNEYLSTSQVTKAGSAEKIA